jgi:hypothetical protein
LAIASQWEKVGNFSKKMGDVGKMGKKLIVDTNAQNRITLSNSLNMTADEALDILNQVLKQKRLNQIQQLVFSQSWTGQTYGEIAENAGYDFDYIKEVGSQLWQSLSEALGEKVTKKNVQSVLEYYQRVSKAREQERKNPPSLEFPSSPVPLDSIFYIERPPIEECAKAEISKPGSLICIKAPRQMGKTSLMHRILAHARQTDLHAVLISLHRADSTVFANLDKFLRWLCANVSRQLGLEPKLDDYWDEDIGSKVSCTIYFQEYLLRAIAKPIVLALDEVNQTFEYPEISGNFLPLLRSWYEDASELSIWQKLRLVVVHTTEVYAPLDINQSPFNVGLPMQLPEFTSKQVQELAVRHGFAWAKGNVGAQNLAPLLALVGGHPYLVRLALYHLNCPEMTIEQLVQDASSLTGIYRSHLRRHLASLQKDSELSAALHKVVTASESVRLEASTAYKLESMGLVKLQGNQATPSCELYRRYFYEQLG